MQSGKDGAGSLSSFTQIIMHQKVISLFDEGLGEELIPKYLVDDLLVVSDDQDVNILQVFETRWDIIRHSCNYFLLNFTVAVGDPCQFGADHSITEYLILFI